MSTAQILRLARLVGRDQFARTGIAEGAAEADGEQRRRLTALVEERTGAIVEELVAEAAASDDVTDVDSAVSYANDALAFLGDLLSERQRDAILEGFRSAAARWARG